MPAHFVDNTVRVQRAYEDKQARGLQGMANNTLRVSNLSAPFRSKGALKSHNVRVKMALGRVTLTWPAVYSQYQNRGMRADGTHRVRRYTTAGTGKGFVDKGVDDTKTNFRRFFV